jgi:hypothetical protein
LYFPLVVYPALLIAATTPPQLLLPRALLGVGAAVAAALFVLAAFYVGDVESMVAAVSAHFAGVASGNPMVQPAHHRHFVELFLDRRSVYFACHVRLVAGALVTLAVLAAALAPGDDRATRVLRLLLLSHLLAFGVYIWPLVKHGTNATVWAAAIESLFFVIAVATVAWGGCGAQSAALWLRRPARCSSTTPASTAPPHCRLWGLAHIGGSTPPRPAPRSARSISSSTSSGRATS